MQEILNIILGFPEPADRPLIIAVSGFGGSGKSTLSRNLKEKLQDAEVVCIDSFATGTEWTHSAEWHNLDRDRFTAEILEPAHADRFPLTYAHVPWPGRVVDPAVTVVRTKYLIIEGCSMLHPDLLAYYDYKIWVDCPLELATERAMWRDRHILHDEQDYNWQHVWMPTERDFFKKYNPMGAADFVYPFVP
jgi:uridine kinase